MKFLGQLLLCLSMVLGLCSCAHTASEPTAKPAAKPGGEEFVYIASVHNTPQAGEPQPNAWFHVYKLLENAGIRTIMTATGGAASISVEQSQSAEAVDLLKKDAARTSYWIEFAKEFR